MTSLPSKHQRIKDACQELEFAIMSFEDNCINTSQDPLKKEAAGLKEIELQLNKIKQQLEDLSS